VTVQAWLPLAKQTVIAVGRMLIFSLWGLAWMNMVLWDTASAIAACFVFV
jgi:hypothetical protein